MKRAKYTIKLTAQFKKDYKLAMKRGLKIGMLEDVVAALAMGEPFPEKNKDHILSFNYKENRAFEFKHSVIVNDSISIL